MHTHTKTARKTRKRSLYHLVVDTISLSLHTHTHAYQLTLSLHTHTDGKKEMKPLTLSPALIITRELMDVLTGYPQL